MFCITGITERFFRSLVLLVHLVLEFLHFFLHFAGYPNHRNDKMKYQPVKGVNKESKYYNTKEGHRTVKLNKDNNNSVNSLQIVSSGRKGSSKKLFCYLEGIDCLPYICGGKKLKKKGTVTFPSLFSMNIETQVQSIEKLVQDILSDDPAYFLVEVRIKPTNNIKVFLDGDAGISIEKCVAYNRVLYKRIEELGLYPDGDFSLEISSPGLDEPLKLFRQYRKNIGRKVEVLLKDGVKTEGKLTGVTEDHIEVEEVRGKNKKQETIRHQFSFENIKSTKIQIVFKN